MSNNNPHGHISQPTQNPSWNPLQIPSYIPRQPQLAHMSNERPMVRSPLAWHAPPPPPDSIYNFMSANHKNLDHQMNPLLPAYVRGPSPFDSMDLSVQSSRNSSSPLGKSGSQHPIMPHDYGHKQQQQQQQSQSQSQLHVPNNYALHISPNSSSATMHSSHQQQRQPSQHSHSNLNPQGVHGSSTNTSSTSLTNAKYINSNGNDCDTLPPHQDESDVNTESSRIIGGSRNSNSSASSTYGREGEAHINENYSKISNMGRVYESEMQQSQSKVLQKPVELVNKDCNYTSATNKTSQEPISPKRQKDSPIRNYHSHSQLPQQSYNSPHGMTHNGPNVSPAQQSPGTQGGVVAAANASLTAIQQLNESRLLHGGNLLDYNQLHLQHNNNYAQHSHQHQMRGQQQPRSPHHQQHIAGHHHFGPHQHHQASMSTQQMQHQSHGQTLSAAGAAQSLATTLEPFISQHNSKVKDLDGLKFPSGDLQAALTPSAAYIRAQSFSSLLPSRIESPATSNDDSLDSNSNGSRVRRKRKPKKLGKVMPNDGIAEMVDGTTGTTVPSTKVELENRPKSEDHLTSQVEQRIHHAIRSQHQSPEQRKSPKDHDVSNPHLLPEQLPYDDAIHVQTGDVKVAKVVGTVRKDDDDEYMKSTIENGCTAIRKKEGGANNDTFNKITALVSETSNKEAMGRGNSTVLNDRKCANSGDSPKTKKQRQVLKLRNVEQNSNSNGSGTSYGENEGGSLPSAANDNAVLAEELCKKSAGAEETTQQPCTIASSPTGQLLSPQSNSRSCSSSSSSSSSCSNSSHSTVSRDQKVKKSEVVVPEVTVESSAVNIVDGPQDPQNKHCENNMVETVAVKTTINEELKSSTKQESETVLGDCKDIKTEAAKSPAKSCFEEVENKLQEMFAGIEDERPADAEEETHTIVSTNDSEVANDLNLALELSTATTAAQLMKTNEGESHKSGSDSLLADTLVAMKVEKPPPTKAAKKSTVVSPAKATESTNAGSKVTSQTGRCLPRRRLSVLMNLRTAMEIEKSSIQREEDEAANEGVVEMAPLDERPSTSAASIATCKAHNLLKENSLNEMKGALVKPTGRANVRRGSKSSGTASKAAKKKATSKKKQKQQKYKKKPDSDDDAPLRDPNGNHGFDTKYKSPYVLVKRDGSICVVNAPTAEDILEKQTKVKKGSHGYTHDRKSLRGMHSSTLSNKYDADTADKTWICVFCKRGPHRMGLGDLFGPYLVSSNCDEYKTAVKAPDAVDLDAVFTNKRRRIDMVQMHPRNLPVVPAGGAIVVTSLTNRSGGNSRKKKKSIDADVSPLLHHDASDAAAAMDSLQDVQNFFGVCKASDGTYEVWLHEDCAVWAPDVFLVGARVLGLDAAVWNSTRYMCSVCSKSGSIICCLQRGCNETAHVPCAKETQWNLDEVNFKVHCHKHASNVTSTSTSSSTLAPLRLLNKALVPPS